MTDKQRHPEDDEQAKEAKLLPARELMSLIDPNPLQPIGGMPTGGMPSTDPGAVQPAADTAGHAQTLVHDHTPAPGPATTSDQPQSVDGTSTTSSSSAT